MRVVLATNQFPKYSETFIVRQFVGLRRLGWDVQVVCPSSDTRQYEFFPEIRSTDYTQRVHVERDVDAAVGRLRPDIVHFEFGTVALGRMDLRERYGCRTVVSFRGYDINYHGLDDPDIYRDVWDHADMVHFVSNDVAERAFRRRCPRSRPWRVIRDAADVDFFTPAPPVPDNETDPFRILSVGRLHWKKGYEFGLEAVARLRRAGVDLRYRIIGDGDMREAVSFAVHDLGLDDITVLSGSASRTEVREALRSADVFLHAAVSEGFCVSALEAQACGLPVVCTDADGLSENVAHGETGLVVPRRDSEALARALGALASDPTLRRRMAAAARPRVVQNFSISEQTAAFDSLYRELLEPLRAAAPRVYEEEKTSQSELERRVAQLDAGIEALQRHQRQFASLRSTRSTIRALIPVGSSVLVVSRGDDQLLVQGTHRCGHFPQDEDGRYAGYHPKDSPEAIEGLEGARSNGVEYLVFPPTSLWWLEHYVELRQYLEKTAVELTPGSFTGAVYDLRPRSRVKAQSSRHAQRSSGQR